MGFEPTTLCYLVRFSTTELLEDSVVSKGQIAGIDWNRRVSSSSVVEHPTRSWRVMGSNPIWDSDFSESTCLLEFT